MHPFSLDHFLNPYNSLKQTSIQESKQNKTKTMSAEIPPTATTQPNLEAKVTQWVQNEVKDIKEDVEPNTAAVKESLTKTVGYLNDCVDRNTRHISDTQTSLAKHQAASKVTEDGYNAKIASYQTELDTAHSLINQISPIVSVLPVANPIVTASPTVTA